MTPSRVDSVWQQISNRPRHQQKTKKPYASFLIDRPFGSICAREEPSVYLMSCLRYRMRLNMLGTENNVSLYDTLLDLSEEFDAAGKGEIFRLLLERRSAIPLFLPHANGSNLMLFKNITSSLSNTTTISLGADKTLGRVAVISRRNANESQSPELLKNLFHIESLHRQDFFENYITRQPITAEIGVGCVKIDEQVQYFLVLHVVGDFQPLWPFV